MVLSEIEKGLADKHPNLLKSDIRKILDIILSEISEALIHSQAVELRGFGRFSIIIKKPRVGRNPRDGSKVEILSKKAIRWKCSKTLFNLLNKNFTENEISANN